MGKAGAGTPKAIANAIKAKGLGRLRWYCQICEKQCRDENGFQAHTKSEPHLRKMLLVGPKAGSKIAEYSKQFQYEFVTLLRTRHQTSRVRANTVYNEYIQDKHHVHMNGTRWVTLSGFIQTIGKAGIVKVDEDEKGLWITWVDDSPKTLAKQAAAQKREKAEMDGEERERMELAAQIARAKAKEAQNDDRATGLQKQEGEKLTLNLFGNNAQASSSGTSPSGLENGQGSTSAGPSSLPGPTAANGESASSTEVTTEKAADRPAISFGTIGTPTLSNGIPTTSAKPAVPVGGNSLKRPAPGNIFKSSKSAKTENDNNSEREREKKGSGGPGYVSVAESLMREDQARKFRKQGGGGGYQGAGPRRDANGGGRRFVLQ